jgi:hypothetical protein
VGNWEGGAYTNDETGAFTHCAAMASYKSGIFFLVSVNTVGSWTLGFTHPTWQLVKGEAVPIGLTFDNRSQFNLHGTVLGTSTVVVPMPIDSELIRRFRKARIMSAVAKGQLFQFKLESTADLLPALVSCVKSGQTGQAASINIPVRPAATPAPAAVGPRANPPETSASVDVQMEAIGLATNFILKSGLHNPKVLSRGETPAEFTSYAAVWRSEEAVGAVRIIPPQPNMKGLDVAATVAASEAKECKGNFASGRVSELVDSDVVFRGFSTCEDSAGPRIAQYFIVPRKRGGFVMFSVVVRASTEISRKITQDDKLAEFRKAALTSVVD